ncbi:type VI secretion system-associated protein TagF [Mesorhizobium sp. RP14(2022)]|uniref:Type VI secretion system-associated protein TagF n=1 Tax=Mesorhizobium liriopis TaxID=2953882 RepID=A0ABT1CC65_9HYPH|nr:type VI secretion system-associated protein TagF [Mesorhizobium liriopis]
MRAAAPLSRGLEAETGFFGKLASQGDFVANRFDRSLRDLLDRWLQKALDHERRERGEAWRAGFAKMPAWRFVLGAEVVGRTPVMGVMVPSTDRVGRAFPLFLVSRLLNYRGPTRALCGESNWFTATETLLRRATAPGFDFASFDRQLAQLPPATGDSRAYQSLPPETDRSFWWTEGRREDRRFAALGLPAPDSFGRFLGSATEEEAAPLVSARNAAVPRPVVAHPSPPPPARSAPRPVRAVEPLRADAAGTSHPGTRLRLNADRLSDPALAHLHALADGQGESPAAAQAAELTIERLSRVEPAERLADLVASAKGALGSVNTLLRIGADEPPSVAVVALVSTQEEFAVVWAGDARVYLFRDGLMRPLTRDHMEVGLRRRLSRSVGGAAQFACDTVSGQLQDGDRFLLLSGALPRVVPERLIATRMSELETEALAEALIQDALIAGAPDNISACAVSFGGIG